MNIHESIHAKTNHRYGNITEMPYEEGGFGRLYKAVDTKNHQQEVCIKVIKPNLSKDLQIKLWREEMQALQQYHNRSGIVHLIDEQYEFERDEAYWFLVMEYVHGKRLGSSKYRIELDVQEEQAIRLLFQLCSVIFSIHKRGHYHQDIFPDNIKIQDEKLVLLDLGGMREAERRSGTIIFGGEMYSPPEVSPTRLRMKRFRTLRKQEMGSFESADIFSIGAIFYELMMGTSFYDGIEQSNQLKDYIYDYYSDPETLERMRKEYRDALELAEENQRDFYTFLERYQFPPDLCRNCADMLSVYPQKRPSIDELLDALLPYIFERANILYHRKHWKDAQMWISLLTRHFYEIHLERYEPNEILREHTLQHFVIHFPLYMRSCLMLGGCQFYQKQFEIAQQTFLRTQEMLEQYILGCEEPVWNGFFLKTLNNLAACYAKRSQEADALDLLKSLSTAQGKCGQIISHNAQVCAQAGSNR